MSGLTRGIEHSHAPLGLVQDIRVTNRANAWTTIGGWATADSRYPTLHVRGPGSMFTATTGIFVAPVTGYYYAAASVRILNADGRFFRLVITSKSADEYSII